ncbi:MAG: hypothetical protein V1918_09105 [Planctomycetota bacterium]
MPDIACIATRLKGWLKAFLGRCEPGLVPFTANSDRIPPSAGTGLSPSVLGLKAAMQTGLWAGFPPDVREAWIDRILSFQSQKTFPEHGFFVDRPVEALLDKPPLWPRVLFHPWRLPLWLWRMGTLRQTWAALSAAGAGGRVATPVALQDERFVRRWWRGINRMPDLWARYAHVSAAVTILWLARRYGAPLPVSPEEALGNFDWEGALKGLSQAPPKTAVSGAMKLVTLSDLVGKPLPWPERMIDLALAVPRAEHVCYLLNPLCVLDRAARLSHHRSAEVAAFRQERSGRLQDFLAPDGGAMTTTRGSIVRYNHLKVGRGAREGDVHGAHMVAWALTLLARAEGIELGWTEPPT